MKNRWGILRDVILNDHKDHNKNGHQRENCIEKYKIEIKKRQEPFVENDDETNNNHHRQIESIELNIIMPSQHLTLKDFKSEYAGFLNTGMVRLWPSEFALAKWCNNNIEFFRNKTVLELGAGLTGFAGLSLSCFSDGPSTILLTDGNPKAIEDKLSNISLNKNITKSSMEATQLTWGESQIALDEQSKKFDIVICADCLYEVSLHEKLLETIRSRLHDDSGISILICPERGSSLQKFLSLVKKAGYWNNVSVDMLDSIYYNEHYSNNQPLYIIQLQ